MYYIIQRVSGVGFLTHLSALQEALRTFLPPGGRNGGQIVLLYIVKLFLETRQGDKVDQRLKHPTHLLLQISGLIEGFLLPLVLEDIPSRPTAHDGIKGYREPGEDI